MRPDDVVLEATFTELFLDYKTGFGGQYGVQEDRVDRSAVGWDHREQAAKHESQARQEDFKTGLGGAREEGRSMDIFLKVHLGLIRPNSTI